MGQCAPCLDADLVLSIGLQEAGNLEAVFKAAGFLTELRRGDDEDPIPAMLRARDSYGNTVDLLLGMRGMERRPSLESLKCHFRAPRSRSSGARTLLP
jgi:hypothetical protein